MKITAFFYSLSFQTKMSTGGLIGMNKPLKEEESLPVKGQDFADPKEELKEKPSSHGEVANQKGGDFSELEESRMENPPEHRDENGSGKKDVDSHTGLDQQKGVK